MSFPTLVGGPGTLRNGEFNFIDWWNLVQDFTSEDWREAVSLYSPSQLSIGGKRSRATLTGYVPWAKIQKCVLWLLGFSWVDSSGYLRREVPANHPLFNNLFANEIVDCVGVEWIPPKRPKPHPWSMPYAVHNLAKITIGYSQPPFEILSDDQLVMTNPIAYRGQELRRYISWCPKPYVDLLEMPGAYEKFVAPAGTTIGGVTLNGLPTLSSRLLIRAQKSTLKLTWHDIPIDFVCNQYGAMPKLEAAIGKINKDDFFGVNNVHTWLLDDVDVVGQNVYADPLASHVLSLDPDAEGFASLARRMDLMFTFRHFDPPNANPVSTERGWRLRPAANGKWYPVEPTVAGGLSLPEDTEFQKLFTHWTDV